MSDYTYQDPNQNHLSNTFDQHYNASTELLTTDHSATLYPQVDLSSGNYSHDIFQHQDPLSHVQQFDFKPFQTTGVGDTHFVKPHYVDPYIKKDGTLVDGYYRDGDGNTNIDRPLEAGGGYLAHNPK